MRRWGWLLVGWSCLAAAAAPAEQLVFGSFRDAVNAERHAGDLARLFDAAIVVEPVHRDGTEWHRVRSGWLSPAERARLEGIAARERVEFWIVRGTVESPNTVTAARGSAIAPAGPTPATVAQSGDRAVRVRAGDRVGVAAPDRNDPSHTGVLGGAADGRGAGYTDVDLGLQARTYRQQGLDGQGRFQPSVSARATWQRAWADGTQSFTATPFVRLDAEDDERTHFDLRELYWSLLGSDWEVHAGFRQVFWGVTEFKHVVDIINQTDFVEDPDGEEKLGQPMLQASFTRDWGVLDLFLLTGFRERTFPGPDGRLRWALPVDTDRARFESGAGAGRMDGAIRWSGDIGPLGFGVYHFSGTSRDPLFSIRQSGTGALELVPEYPVIDQTGLDAQWLTGDWAFKFEGIRRSGFGPAYVAYNAGFERTLVGVLGSRADLGLVVEYLYDERGDRAFDTLFERDVALGTRWSFNDVADTQALAGFIFDRRTSERVVTLEATRRLGAAWLFALEGRIFDGADAPAPGEPLESLLAPERKSASFQRDDYLQLELTWFF